MEMKLVISHAIVTALLMQHPFLTVATIAHHTITPANASLAGFSLQLVAAADHEGLDHTVRRGSDGFLHLQRHHHPTQPGDVRPATPAGGLGRRRRHRQRAPGLPLQSRRLLEHPDLDAVQGVRPALPAAPPALRHDGLADVPPRPGHRPVLPDAVPVLVRALRARVRVPRRRPERPTS
jgi:hypothetical protein